MPGSPRRHTPSYKHTTQFLTGRAFDRKLKELRKDVHSILKFGHFNDFGNLSPWILIDSPDCPELYDVLRIMRLEGNGWYYPSWDTVFPLNAPPELVRFELRIERPVDLQLAVCFETERHTDLLFAIFTAGRLALKLPDEPRSFGIPIPRDVFFTGLVGGLAMWKAVRQQRDM